jgi:hypothetical protein
MRRQRRSEYEQKEKRHRGRAAHNIGTLEMHGPVLVVDLDLLYKFRGTVARRELA